MSISSFLSISLIGITTALMLPSYINARKTLEYLFEASIWLSVLIVIIINICILSLLLSKTFVFFYNVSIFDFITGTRWHPESDEITNSFGVIPLILGTILVTTTSLMLAIPFSLLATIYITEYAPKNLRNIVKSKLEILTGIPTIVYGYLAITTITPAVKFLGTILHINISSECSLSAGIAIGIMIIPLITSLSYDVIMSVPKSLKYASLALGATKLETFSKITFPAAFPGILSAILIALSRAIGETMIVLMTVGSTAHMTFNPLESITTITVQIVKLLAGDQSFDNLSSNSAYVLGLLLFSLTWILNAISFLVIKNYRKKL